MTVPRRHPQMLSVSISPSQSADCYGARSRIQTYKRSLPSGFKPPAFVSFAMRAYSLSFYAFSITQWSSIVNRASCHRHKAIRPLPRAAIIAMLPALASDIRCRHSPKSTPCHVCGPCQRTGTASSNPYHGTPRKTRFGPGSVCVICGPSGPLSIVAWYAPGLNSGVFVDLSKTL